MFQVFLYLHPEKNYDTALTFCSIGCVFSTETEKLPKQSINQEICQSKARGINQSCEVTAEVWRHNKRNEAA